MATSKQVLEYEVRLRDLASKILKDLGTTAKRETRKINRAFVFATKTLKKYALGLKVAAAAMAFFALRSGSRRVLEFSKAMGEVRTIMDETTVSFTEAEAQVRKLAIQLGNPAPAVAKGLYQTLSAGVTDSAEALVLMGQAGKLAVAGLATTKQSVDLLTTIINAYGETVTKEGIEKTSDMIFQMVRLGKLTIPETAAAFGRVIPQAAVLGVSLEEVAAAVGTLTLSGLSASEAVTQMTSLFTAFLRKAEVAKVLYPKLNNLMGMNAIRSKGLAKAMQDIADATGGSGDEIIKLMGRQEGMKALMALTGKQAGQFAKQLRMIGGASGETGVAFKKMMNTIERRYAVLKEGVIQGLEGIVVGVMETILSSSSDIDEFTKSVEELKEAIASLAPVAEAGGSVFTVALASLQTGGVLIRKRIVDAEEMVNTGLAARLQKLKDNQKAAGVAVEELTAKLGKLEEREASSFKTVWSRLHSASQGLLDPILPGGNEEESVKVNRQKEDALKGVSAQLDEAKNRFNEYGDSVKGVTEELRIAERVQDAHTLGMLNAGLAAKRQIRLTLALAAGSVGLEVPPWVDEKVAELERARDEFKEALAWKWWQQDDSGSFDLFRDAMRSLDTTDLDEALAKVERRVQEFRETFGPHKVGRITSEQLGGGIDAEDFFDLPSREMAELLSTMKVLETYAERLGVPLTKSQLLWKSLVKEGTLFSGEVKKATGEVEELFAQMAGTDEALFDFSGMVSGFTEAEAAILKGNEETISRSFSFWLDAEKNKDKIRVAGHAKERAAAISASKEEVISYGLQQAKLVNVFIAGVRKAEGESAAIREGVSGKLIEAEEKRANEAFAARADAESVILDRQLKDIEKKYAAFARLQGAALASTMGAAFKKLAGDFEITPKMNFELLKADFEAAQKELDDVISAIYGVPEEGATPLRAGMEGFLDPEQLAMVQLFLDRWKETTLASAEVAANARLVGTNLAESLGGALEFVSQYAEFEVTPKLELEILKEMLAQAEQELANKPITLEFTVEDRAHLEAMVEGIRSGRLLTLEWEASFTKLGTTLAESLDPSLANLTQYASFDVTPTLQLEQFNDDLAKLKVLFDQPISLTFSAEQKESLGALIFDLETVGLKTLEADAALFNYLRTLEGLGPVVGGLKTGFAQFIDQIPDLGTAIADVTSGALNSFVTGMTNAFSSFIDDSKSANEAWKDFAREFLRQIAAMIIQMLILQAIKAIFPTVGAAAGGVAEGGVGELGTIAGQDSPIRRAEGGYIPGGLGPRTAIDWKPAMEFAKGGVVPDGLSTAVPMGLGRALPVRGYAMGGSIVKEPHMAVIGEGKMNEAIVPLPDGRSIPVEMRGGGETSISFTINAVDARGVDELLVERQDTIRSIIRQAMTEDRLFRNTMRGG